MSAFKIHNIDISDILSVLPKYITIDVAKFVDTPQSISYPPIETDILYLENGVFKYKGKSTITSVANS